MVAYTKGSLRHGYFIAEANYGVTPATAFSYAGDSNYYELKHNDKPEFKPGPGSRAWTTLQVGPYEKAFRYSARARVASWKGFWALYGMGSLTGTGDDIGDFTFQDDVYDGTTHGYHVANGCKFDQLEIVAPGPGQLYEFIGDIMCQWEESQATRVLHSLQDVTLGAEPSIPAGAELTWNANSQINIAGGGLADWYLQDWKLTVKQNLSRKDGILTGHDTYKYPTTVALNPGALEVFFECSIISENHTYYDLLKNHTLITQVTLPIDTDSVKLNTGYLIPDTWPKWDNMADKNIEKLKFKFTTVTI